MQIVTLKEVSQFLKVKESTLYSWAEKGLIPARKLNGLWRFDMDEIREWFRNSIKRPVKADMAFKKSVKRSDVDAIIKKVIDDVNGKGYNSSIGKPGPNQALRKED